MRRKTRKGASPGTAPNAWFQGFLRIPVTGLLYYITAAY